MGLGPAQSYLAKYNDYTLPGYVQHESFETTSRIQEHYAPFADGSDSENTGLQNKAFTVTLKVWEQDYQTCKQIVRQAATMLRSKRSGFAPLYVGNSDRYYDAMVGTVRAEKTAGESVRTLEYQVDFQCKPWAISNASYTVSGGSGTLSTAGRTIDDGGWTYANFLLTGTNITVSGYTSSGEFAGFISVSGAVTNLYINSEDYSATIGTTNKNNVMKNIDYQMWVGPEVTYYAVTGATSCVIDYQNRWYI